MVQRKNSYQVGDVVSFKMERGNGKQATILHRVIGILPDGGYRVRGDTAVGWDEVQEKDIKGRMVLGIPGLGFLSAVPVLAPLLIGPMVLALLFLIMRPKKNGAQKLPQLGRIFVLSALVLAFSYSFAVEGLAADLGKTLVFLVLLGFLAATRLIEVRTATPGLRSVAEANYISVTVLALSTVSLPYLVDSLRQVVTT